MAMLNFDITCFVRHGDYDRRSQELTAEGRAQSENAGRQLRFVGVDRRAKLLSSNAIRALRTSAIIEQTVGAITAVHSSRRINIIGNNPRGVESLDDMLEAALADVGAEPNGESLIVVAHQPLLEVVSFGAHVANGQIVEYKPQTWENPDFNLREQERLLKELGAAGLV